MRELADLRVALTCLTLTGLVAAHTFAAEGGKEGGLRMALVNMKSVYSDLADEAARKAALDANLRRHLYFIDRAVEQGAEFVGFPELSINGYRFSANMAWLSLDGPEVGVLARKAREKGVYISAGIAEQDAQGKRWNTQFVLGPDGKIVGRQNKIWLTKEKGLVESGTEHNVFEVKGLKMGVCICADGTDFANLKALADNGAQLIYGPHANTTGGTIAKWYNFRGRWGGPATDEMVKSKTSNDGPVAEMPKGGWIAKLKVYAALHNHAGLYNPEYAPPSGADSNTGWASGAWFIGPDGQTLAQMPPSTDRGDSKEYLLICTIPLPQR